MYWSRSYFLAPFFPVLSKVIYFKYALIFLSLSYLRTKVKKIIFIVDIMLTYVNIVFNINL